MWHVLRQAKGLVIFLLKDLTLVCATLALELRNEKWWRHDLWSVKTKIVNCIFQALFRWYTTFEFVLIFILLGIVRTITTLITCEWHYHSLVFSLIHSIHSFSTNKRIRQIKLGSHRAINPDSIAKWAINQKLSPKWR